MSLLLLFQEGGGTAENIVYRFPKIIILTNGHLAIRLGGTLYQEL